MRKRTKVRKLLGRSPEEKHRHTLLVRAINRGASIEDIAREFCVEKASARKYIYLYRRTRRDPLLD